MIIILIIIVCCCQIKCVNIIFTLRIWICVNNDTIYMIT